MDLVDILAGLGPENLAEKRKALMQWRINSAMGMLAPTTGTGVEAATRMLPMTGEAWTANDAGNAIQEGQYGKAAMMGLLGLLPLGGMMSAGLRAGATVPKRMGQSGAIAWHGSPHKFDKFSLDKIGTGEGAQAYGHGLYLAEAPDVAKSYQALHGAAELRKGGNRVAMYGSENKGVLDELARHGGNFDSAIASQEKLAKDYNGMFAGNANKIKQTLEEWKANGYEAVPLGNMYKTDIPDEAVARFLDWDKPLSQQSKEVQAALSGVHKARNEYEVIQREPYFKNAQFMVANKKTGNGVSYFPTQQEAEAFISKMAEDSSSGMHIYNNLGKDAHSTLQGVGIPGIRYLDGGSRGRTGGELIDVSQKNGQWFSKIRKDGSKISGQIGDVIPQGRMFTTSMPFKTESEARQWAQQQINGGTSNFVAFDPELIRILERNGIPTGNQPWKPGEWQGMLSGTK